MNAVRGQHDSRVLVKARCWRGAKSFLFVLFLFLFLFEVEILLVTFKALF